MFGDKDELKQILEELRKIYAVVRPRLSATLTLKGENEMPITISPGGQAQADYQEWSGLNGSGTQLPPAGPVAFASDNPSVATVDPNSGLVTGVSAGTANISGSDATDGLSASDVVTVSGGGSGAALSATLTLQPVGSPAAQAAAAKLKK